MLCQSGLLVAPAPFSAARLAGRVQHTLGKLLVQSGGRLEPAKVRRAQPLPLAAGATIVVVASGGVARREVAAGGDAAATADEVRVRGRCAGGCGRRSTSSRPTSGRTRFMGDTPFGRGSREPELADDQGHPTMDWRERMRVGRQGTYRPDRVRRLHPKGRSAQPYLATARANAAREEGGAHQRPARLSIGRSPAKPGVG